jgi:hypothetical protein
MKILLRLFFVLALSISAHAQLAEGIAVDPNTYSPNHTINKAAPLVLDKNTGALIVSGGSGGSGGAVTIADGANQTLGAKADASASSDSGTFSLVSLFKRLLAKIPTVGQTTKSGSLPVTLASDQGALTVTVASPSVVSSTALEASHVIKSSSGKLIALIGYNGKSSAQFIQIHNATSLPAESSIPLVTFKVPGDSNFSFDLTLYGLPLSTGIVVCNSSTAETKTIGSADCFFTATFN